MQMILIGIVLVITGIATAQIWRATGFAREIDALNARIGQGDTAPGVDLAALPPIVRAFAERNGGTVGAAPVVVATQQAEMRLAPDQPFFALSATQRSGTRQSDFVWHAKGTMMGVVPVEVVDAYVGGAGLLEARLAGAITVAEARGAAADRGEAPSCPSIPMPSSMRRCWPGGSSMRRMSRSPCRSARAPPAWS